MLATGHAVIDRPVSRIGSGVAVVEERITEAVLSRHPMLSGEQADMARKL
jgi:hypothetical protein